MIHFAPPRLTADQVPHHAASALKPSAYLRLRRVASGMTPREVGARIAASNDDMPSAIALVALLETPGVVAKREETLEALRGVFRFDADVYRQLARDPEGPHPQICQGCGCSAWDPHVDADGCEKLEWAASGLCTICADAKALLAGRAR